MTNDQSITTKRVKHITHTDLDGAGCEIVMNMFTSENGCSLSTEHLDYDKIDNYVKQFINSGEYENYDKVFITDISVSDEIAQLISQKGRSSFILIDHHETVLPLNKYQWAHVTKNKVSATEHLYEFLKMNYKNLGFERFLYISPVQSKDALRTFINHVTDYDTWQWKVKQNNFANDLNSLLGIYGMSLFVREITEKIYCRPVFNFDYFEFGF